MPEEHDIKEEKEKNDTNNNNFEENKDNNVLENKDKEVSNLDDFQEYMKEIKLLKSDFSDLEDLDLEEIEEMKEAILEVQQSEEIIEVPTNQIPQTLEIEEQIINKMEEIEETVIEENEIIEETNMLDGLEQKESMMIDFSDLGKTDLNELIEMKRAVETVKKEDLPSKRGSSRDDPSVGLSDELDRKILEEIGRKKKKKKKKIITEEDFVQYAKTRRDKIWYHALNYLTFRVEDYTSSKYLLYDMLKQDTSKSPIDPIPEHQFYFGLGYLLRLKIENNQLVRYLGGGKFRIKYDIESIKRILEDTGPPIITKPVIKEDVQKKYFKDFLKDDFMDI